MAFDELDQVGKQLKKTRDSADYALSRYHARIPIVERIRDVMDANNSFIMEFKTPRNDTEVKLDLNFKVPAPTSVGDSNSGAGIEAVCETYSLSCDYINCSSDYYIALNQPYLPNSVRIYDANGNAIDPSKWYEYNPVGGVIYIMNSESSGLFDNFNRNVSAGGWGTSTSGLSWTATADPSDFSVNGSQGVLSFSSGTPTISVDGGPWTRDTWTMMYRFTTGSLGSALRSIGTRLVGPDMNRLIFLNLSASDGSLEIESDIYAINFISDSQYVLKITWDRLSGIATIKIWLDADSEPSIPQITVDWGAGNQPLTTLSISGQFASGTPYTHYVDSITFDSNQIITICYVAAN